METTEIKEKVRNALNTFIENDKKELLSADIYEPTLSHRIALYLENEFADNEYVVDCEYNKNMGDPKQDDSGNKVRPDIIVHRRNTGDNLVIFEIKKSGRNSQKGTCDVEKLQRYSNLHYRLGIFLGVLKTRVDIVWVEGGNVTIETI